MQARRRVLALATFVVGGLVTSVLLAAPALALEDGEDPGEGLGLLPLLLIFVGVPLLTFIVLAVAIYGPSRLHRPRYRPGVREWSYAPVWIGGPDDAQTVLTRTPTDKVLEVRGGGAGAGW